MDDRRTLNRACVPGSVIKYIRIGRKLPLSLSTNESQLINISKSGACIGGEFSFETGDAVIVKILFPDGTKLKLRGKVRWKEAGSEGNAVGIQFFPFGVTSSYNSIKALKYLRSLSGQAIEKQDIPNNNNFGSELN